MQLDEITRGEVKRFIYQQQKKGLSSATVRKHLAYFSNIMSHGLDDEIITVNPAQKLSKLIPRKDRKADINPLNKEELQVFLNTVRSLYPRHYPFSLCAARTGMRLGEVMALEWGAVDFFGRSIEMRQAFSRHCLTSPKNKRLRKVDMSRQLTEVLKGHKASMREEALKKGQPMPKWAFVQENGKNFGDSQQMRSSR